MTEQIYFLHNLGWDSKKWFWHLYVTYIYREKKIHVSITGTFLCSGGLLISLQNRQRVLYINIEEIHLASTNHMRVEIRLKK